MLMSLPVGENPFHHDLFNMGIALCTNLVVMHGKHFNEHQPWIHVVNTVTGERMRIELTNEPGFGQSQKG